ncbi:hypothetical protein SMALB_5670 [Streptomyces malaysiensis]|uniref:Uncharacterized protein n=1 Tax=Streptomyces malaysiensis TaxID=92644 RepID=A0A7X6AZ92_STRMQ|nr:hypothetical protein [Streptomyces malaysiensis]
MATIRNLAIGTLKILGADNIAKTTRAIRHDPQRALAVLGITNNRTLTELDQALARCRRAVDHGRALQTAVIVG